MLVLVLNLGSLWVLLGFRCLFAFGVWVFWFVGLNVWLVGF